MTQKVEVSKMRAENNSIPESWLLVELIKICQSIETKDPNLESESAFQYIDISSIDNTTKKITSPKSYLGKNAPSRARQLVKANDIVFSTVRTYLMNIALVPDTLDGQIASTGFCIIRPINIISSRLLFYYVTSYKFIEALNNLQRGSSYPAVRNGDVLRQPFPLPPLFEQHRIVAKIEELFSDLDVGIENLKTARSQLKIYRQSVLKWAFEGKLTAEWRQEQQRLGKLQSAEELLAQIKVERENRYQQQVKDWEKSIEDWKANDKTDKKPTKLQNLKNIEPLNEIDIAKLPVLPKNWLWMNLEDFIDEPRYGTSKKCTYESTGKGVIRIPNIQRGAIDKTDFKYAEFNQNEIEAYSLKEGDFLTIRSNGSVSIVGKCALIKESDEGFLFAGYLIRLRPYKILVDSKYLLSCFDSIFLRNQIESKAKSTSGVNNINADELKKLRIPYCSIEEQHQIVQEIESRLSICDNLENTIEENLQRAESLRQSILKQAFTGKLVPQDPNDEPAAQLLARIQQEQSAQQPLLLKPRKPSKKTP
jgi:type I restriction enzyme, S subunit